MITFAISTATIWNLAAATVLTVLATVFGLALIGVID